MSATESPQSTDPRVSAYLDALSRALFGLPEPSRSEVYDEIRQHIADQLAQRGDDPAAIPEVLDRLGDPAAIAREAGVGEVPPAAYSMPGGYQVPPPRKSRVHEVFAVVLVAIGGFVFLFGWLVGIVLLWTSDRFTKADKIIGTLLIPGGFAAGLFIAFIGAFSTGSVQTCVSHASSGTGAVSLSETDCSGGPSTLFSVIAITVVVILLLGPLYTTIRLSRRVARM